MKKFFKSLSMICLALVLLCPLALVGCDRNYTVNIKIAQGENCGFVYLKDVEGISVLGDNTVKSGEKFEYYIVPATGYRISKVVVDNKEQTNYEDSGAYFYFDDIKKDHKVQVYFAAKSYTVNFYCLSAGGAYEAFGSVQVQYGSSINLNQATYGGETALWYVKNGNQNIYIYNGLTDKTAAIPTGYADSNLLFVYNNKNVYCDKTAAELSQMGVVIPN